MPRPPEFYTQNPAKREPSLRSTWAVAQREALSCLQRVAPKGPGVEGTRYEFPNRSERR